MSEIKEEHILIKAGKLAIELGKVQIELGEIEMRGSSSKEDEERGTYLIGKLMILNNKINELEG